MSVERIIANAMKGTSGSPLLTDGYKFSMAQAGFPLRQETFTLSFRKGGPFLVPINYTSLVPQLRPRELEDAEQHWLGLQGYEMTSAMQKALRGDLRIWAAPKGSWVNAGEPVITVSGPSFLVSWLEPLLIMVNFHLQVATALQNGVREFKATCSDEALIIQALAEAVGIPRGKVFVQVNMTDYQEAVARRVGGVVEALNGDAHRAFEVGLRAATCLRQHMAALAACQAAGITSTSNTLGAYLLGMTPVGTTGHEHQQRWGEDLAGFRAIRDMRTAPPSYLFDTYDAFGKGIPALTQAIEEDYLFQGSVRFDSGDQTAQLLLILEKVGKAPNFIFEDGYTAVRTLTNEKMCVRLGIPSWQRKYGYGGYLVCAADWQQYTRNGVSAVYKLSESCGPKMKFAGTKSSLPGCPVTLVSDTGIRRLVAQLGEELPGFHPLSADDPWFDGAVLDLSPLTRALVAEVASAAGISSETSAAALERYGK